MYVPAPSPVKEALAWKRSPASMEYSSVPPGMAAVAERTMAPPSGVAHVGAVAATSSMLGASTVPTVTEVPAEQPLASSTLTA